jgi:hypothetical protein
LVVAGSLQAVPIALSSLTYVQNDYILHQTFLL